MTMYFQLRDVTIICFLHSEKNGYMIASKEQEESLQITDILLPPGLRAAEYLKFNHLNIQLGYLLIKLHAIKVYATR